jgi:hypothetical protein
VSLLLLGLFSFSLRYITQISQSLIVTVDNTQALATYFFIKDSGCINPNVSITTARTIIDPRNQIVTLKYLRERQRPLPEVASNDMMVKNASSRNDR